MINAPILLFTYNRLWHTRQTVEALSNNHLARKSDLWIYSDAPKSSLDEFQVLEVRKYLKNINGFNKVNIVEHKQNSGLASNIINGVTEVINRYGRVIVLEDDILVSPNFLNYMNDALTFYADKKQVMHISGWNYPIDADNLPETFLWRVMNCWGWGTWADRWQYYRCDPGELVNSFTKDGILLFNLDDTYDFWGQVVANIEGRINTWAIFWYASIFKRDGLCLNPSRSLTKNIGLDGTGIHCGEDEYPNQLIYKDKVNYFEGNLIENDIVVELVKNFLRQKKPSLLQRIISRVKRYFSLDFSS